MQVICGYTVKLRRSALMLTECNEAEKRLVAPAAIG